jgi:ribosomal protein L37AE/L43A
MMRVPAKVKPLTSIAVTVRNRRRTTCPSCVTPYIVKRDATWAHCTRCGVRFELVEETANAT